MSSKKADDDDSGSSAPESTICDVLTDSGSTTITPPSFSDYETNSERTDSNPLTEDVWLTDEMMSSSFETDHWTLSSDEYDYSSDSTDDTETDPYSEKWETTSKSYEESDPEGKSDKSEKSESDSGSSSDETNCSISFDSDPYENDYEPGQLVRMLMPCDSDPKPFHEIGDRYLLMQESNYQPFYELQSWGNVTNKTEKSFYQKNLKNLLCVERREKPWGKITVHQKMNAKMGMARPPGRRTKKTSSSRNEAGNEQSDGEKSKSKSKKKSKIEEDSMKKSKKAEKSKSKSPNVGKKLFPKMPLATPYNISAYQNTMLTISYDPDRLKKKTDFTDLGVLHREMNIYYQNMEPLLEPKVRCYLVGHDDDTRGLKPNTDVQQEVYNKSWELAAKIEEISDTCPLDAEEFLDELPNESDTSQSLDDWYDSDSSAVWTSDPSSSSDSDTISTTTRQQNKRDQKTDSSISSWSDESLYESLPEEDKELPDGYAADEDEEEEFAALDYPED